ncbi:unnamed protein product [Caenorhabditis angaria]|uniref:MPN domain-containing protein n=1 Tax=Caenorhabditis angaria TaxID=860376 RepID=A0A9P1I393_9PELO|nr:unnamed protein product [Caenorhabditis angaria]
MVKLQVETLPVPYSTIILHCLKYPSNGVLGLLIGQKKGGKITVSSSVPICHEATPLAPSLEIATTLVHSKFGAQIVGVYFANSSANDKSLNPYAIRLAERISSVTNSSAILIQVINDRLMADCEEDRLVAYEKETENWKEAETMFQGANILRGLQAAIQKKLYRDLNDFENHLDNPEIDFYNTNLGKKLASVAELRA